MIRMDELEIGTKVLVYCQEQQSIGRIIEMAGDQKIQSFGILEYDLRVKCAEYSTFLCDIDSVICIVADNQKIFEASQLDKIGRSTFTGSGQSRDILADDLETAMSKTLEWVNERHPEVSIEWKDQTNYRFSDERASGTAVVCSDQIIDSGWHDSWIDVRVTVQS